MITVLGVGHVFDISTQVRKIIEDERPDAVCVELDPLRYQALINPPRDNPDVPLAYNLLASFQRRLARSYGGEVGAEMLAAIKAAGAVGSEVMLIDVNATQMFRRLWQEMPSLEKVKLGLSAISSLFLSRRRVEKELENFQEHEELYLEEMAQQFPTLKRMLIDDRNHIMAQRIDAAASAFPNVLAVVGDGHVEGIVRLLGRDDITIIRLRELLGQGSMPVDDRDGNAQACFHYEYSLRDEAF
ncbi:MAG: hypothetical protein GX307_04275 [Euryarchaeota archaeon]|nr:hypothetical protein [Euryarchaeota archaeon]